MRFSRHRLTSRGFVRPMAALLFAAAGMFSGAGSALATPSTTYWTPAVMDVQPAGQWHITYDTYSSRRAGGDLSTDLGLSYGFRLSKDLNAEVGFDWMSRVAYPVYLNAKVGVAEGVLGKGAPGVNIGVFGVGTKKADLAAGVAGTDQNVFDLIVGKTLAPNFRVHGAYYTGNKNVLVSSTGKKENDGFMLGFDYGFKPTPEGYNKFVIAGDYASGKNAIGGGGAGVYWYFTKSASLLVGPVWYNDQGINGKAKWTTQIDINF